jgi:hypothetical protein
MQPFNCFRKFIYLALASAIISPLAVNAAHYRIPAQQLGIENDPYYQNVINEDCDVWFTLKLKVYKFQTYPVGFSMTVEPYVASLDDYVNTDNGSSNLCNIIKLNPQFHLPADTPAEVEDRYLELNGREIPEESLRLFEAISISFLTEQNRCMDFEEGKLNNLSLEERIHIYDKKCQLEEQGNDTLKQIADAMRAAN